LSLIVTVRVEPTVVVAIAAGSARLGAGVEPNFAETKPADPATAGYAPPNAASSEAAAVPPSGSIGAPARSFIAWRREGWRMSYSNLLLDCSTVSE